MIKHDGGLAFPGRTWSRSYEADVLHPGMTLRDYFAGQALAGLLGKYSLAPLDKSVSGEEAMALASYVVADAMLAERAKGGGE